MGRLQQISAILQRLGLLGRSNPRCAPHVLKVPLARHYLTTAPLPLKVVLHTPQGSSEPERVWLVSSLRGYGRDIPSPGPPTAVCVAVYPVPRSAQPAQAATQPSPAQPATQSQDGGRR